MIAIVPLYENRYYLNFLSLLILNNCVLASLSFRSIKLFPDCKILEWIDSRIMSSSNSTSITFESLDS